MKRLLPILSVVLLILGLLGCALDRASANMAPPSKRLFIVLLDETGNSGVDKFWDKAVGFASALAQRIRQEDAYVLIGIDDHAGDPADVRVTMQEMDPNPIKAMGMKRGLAATVKQLKVRNPKVENTDILGAIATAASIAARHKEYLPELVFFSDMDQFPTLPTIDDVKRRGIQFAGGGTARMFFFNAVAYSRRNHNVAVDQAEKAMIKAWLGIFSAAGISAASDNFVNESDTASVFNRLYPPML